MTPDWSLMAPRSFLRFLASSLTVSSGWTLSVWFLPLLWIFANTVPPYLGISCLYLQGERVRACQAVMHVHNFLQMRMYVFLIYTDQKIIFLGFCYKVNEMVLINCFWIIEICTHIYMYMYIWYISTGENSGLKCYLPNCTLIFFWWREAGS